MYHWIVTQYQVTIIILKTCRQENLRHIKSTVIHLTDEISFYTTQQIQNNTQTPGKQAGGGGGGSTFDWHGDKLLLEELPVHVRNFPCHVPHD